MSAIIGRQLDSGDPLAIGDGERQGGLYVLGRPRMGKSWLLVNLALQDIRNGFGIFFLDPHGEAEEREEAAKERKQIEGRCAEEVAKISYSPPVLLRPRALNPHERQNLRDACMRQLQQADAKTRSVAATIDDFAAFCELLAKPENQIKVPSGQYREREVNLRTEADMVGEVARELVHPPKYIAYAKLLTPESHKDRFVWTGKIRTEPLPPIDALLARKAEELLEQQSALYTKSRKDIECEIRHRQEGWQAERTKGKPKKEPPAKPPEDSSEPPPLH